MGARIQIPTGARSCTAEGIILPMTAIPIRGVVGTKSLRERTCPSASQLISVIHKESCTCQLCNNRSNLAASVYKIAQHEQCAQLQIS
jgi:hypothetical protein